MYTDLVVNWILGVRRHDIACLSNAMVNSEMFIDYNFFFKYFEKYL